MINKKDLIEEFFHNLNDEDKEEWLEHRKKCDDSLFYFIKEMGGFLRGSNGKSIAGGDSIEYIWKPVCDFWQDNSIKRKFVYEPRRWLKSTNRKWGQIHSYLQNNETRILTASEVEKRAKEWVGWQGKQIMGHQRLRWIYPELTIIDKSYRHANTFSSEKILMPRKGIYDATTFGAIGIHGSSQGGHYDIIEPDDICGEKAMESSIIMEDSFRWFDNVESLLTEPDIDIIRGMGTHWAIGDIGWYIQNEYPEYKWIIVPALKDEELENKENITWLQNPEAKQGESNWEERGSTKYYVDMAANPQTQIRFWTQEQNNPDKAAGTLNKFDRRWLHFYRTEERGEKGTYLICDKCKIEVPLHAIPLYGMADVAGFGETKLMKKGARNALLIGGQPVDMIQKFVVFTWAMRLKKPSTFREELYKAHKKYNPKTWRIDDKGVGSTMYGDILEEIPKKCSHMHISPLPHDTERNIKDSDIQGLIEPISSGQVHLHESMTDLISEMMQYPHGLTKDLIDMLAKLNRLYWMRTKMVDVDKYAEESHVWSVTSRDQTTGY